eukprot:CAMPEP_0168486226 /NCGR_PEP_ID=MMETSP0228-20121227/67014_1 /TAXON_ID=133427 /ORGANISM="Protoceratium reticulatum, Strain CCCM 535 (=CCMP 1889)" /LENGTH=46 /DNA_ID= /DNA_START= /DNA_END= /DNA_ORIENTATION=
MAHVPATAASPEGSETLGLHASVAIAQASSQFVAASTSQRRLARAS